MDKTKHPRVIIPFFSVRGNITIGPMSSWRVYCLHVFTLIACLFVFSLSSSTNELKYPLITPLHQFLLDVSRCLADEFCKSGFTCDVLILSNIREHRI